MKRIVKLLPWWFVCTAVWAEPVDLQQLYELPLDELVRVQIPPQADVGSRSRAYSAPQAIVPTDVYSAEQLLASG